MAKILICAVAAMVASAAWAQEPDLEAMMKAFAGAAQAQPGASAPAMVSPKALKEALPQAVPGFERVEAGSEKQSAFGISTVIATGVYESGEKSIRIELTDMGGMGGLGAMAMMGMANNEVDKETRTGFERTTTVQGFKAVETYDRVSKSGEVQVFLGSRFSVKVDGSELASFDELSAAVAALNLKALSELKPEAPAAAPAP
ncbi:MAG: hypothetical protein EOM72_12005 [Opitutae bacterium]|nr:hypothetical protein [Opitutae bacterium]